jgi:hypothetical protein
MRTLRVCLSIYLPALILPLNESSFGAAIFRAALRATGGAVKEDPIAGGQR